MSNSKMLIDATHPEETRVVVIRNGRVEEFDYESASRKLLRGNIYLAKVTRVEPSLQAAFVEYGGNRHGFLAFNEIHPDYYQIPMADRQALIDEEAAEEARAEAEADARAERMARGRSNGAHRRRGEGQRHQDGEGGDEGSGADDGGEAMAEATGTADDVIAEVPETVGGIESMGGEESPPPTEPHVEDDADDADEPSGVEAAPGEERRFEPEEADRSEASAQSDPVGSASGADDSSDAAGEDTSDRERAESRGTETEAESVEQTGAEDALEELPSRPRRHRRSYKIQEVIKRRQVILVQVVKEERGTKGAALTTYLSLAGRYTVLMPNTARGGGISRKITNPQDRKRLKAIAAELEVPEGMGLIIRTAGATRTKQEIKRDFEYLLRLWESVRELTLASSAPSLVYEEGNLIKRSIRDLYNKDVEEIVVAGEHAHNEAKDFMRMLMPSHTKHVLAHADKEPLFTRYGIERQLNAMFSPYVTLKSGGYLVINQTEALVAVDINSGKSTREFSIEETALNTNLEAADEIARQLKLRDLAGLIVIDFIDMEEKRNNRAVERRIKDALRFDRARIQIGHISHFGLLEMSRQRLRTGVLEGSTSQCPHCQGTGIIRSTESVALAVLRGLEDALMAGTRHSLVATTTAAVALYILNNKRHFINDMESRHGISVTVTASDKLQGANFTIEKAHAPVQQARRPERAAVNMDWGFEGESEGGVEEVEEAPEARDDREDETGGRESDMRSGDGDGGRRRRRRRRGGRDRGERGGDRDGRREQPRGEEGASYDDQPPVYAQEGALESEPPQSAFEGDRPDGGESEESGELQQRQPGDSRDRKDGKRRRRGRRGGRRGRGRNGEEIGAAGTEEYTSEGSSESFAADGDSDEGNVEHSEAASGAESAQDQPPEPLRAERNEPVAREPRNRESSARGRRAAAENPAPAPAEDRVSEPGSAQHEPPQDAAPSEPATRGRRSRDYSATTEPKIERVVVGTGQDGESNSAEPPASPARKGWWQRTLGG